MATAIAERLRSLDVATQLAALVALESVKLLTPDATEAVVALLTSSNTDVASKALALAPQLHPSVVVNLQQRFRREQQSVGAGSLLRRSLPAMIQTLALQLPSLQTCVIPLLREMMFFVPSFVQGRSDEANRFLPALRAVAARGGDPGARIACSLLHRAEPPLIAAIVLALVEAGELGETLIISALANETNEQLAERIAAALGSVESPSGEFVTRLTAHESATVRECGVRTLSAGRCSDELSLTLLTERTRDSSMTLVLLAIQGLATLLRTQCKQGNFSAIVATGAKAIVRNAIYALVRCLADNYDEVKESAATALIEIRDSVYQHDHSKALTQVMPPLDAVLRVVDTCLRDLEQENRFRLQAREQVTLWLLTRCGIVEGEDGRARARNALLLWAMSSDDARLGQLIDEALVTLGAPPND